MGLIKQNLKIKWNNNNNDSWGWVRVKRIKANKLVKTPKKKKRLQKTPLKHIMMLGCVKPVNLDTISY